MSPLHSAAYRGHDRDQSVLSTEGLQTGTDATGQKRTGYPYINHNMIKRNLNITGRHKSTNSTISANSNTKPANKKGLRFIISGVDDSSHSLPLNTHSRTHAGSSNKDHTCSISVCVSEM